MSNNDNNNVCDCPAKIKELCRCSKCSGKEKLFDQFHRFSTIMASAGTGKTYNLAMRYLQLLSFGISPDEILAVTFTRKAAGEIFDKIINRLLEMLESPRCCTLSSKENLQKILQKLLNGENELRISTIDSFFSRLLQAFAPELGIRSDIQMIDENDKRPRQKVIRQWLHSATKDELSELRELIKEANDDKQSGFSSATNTLLKDVYGIYLEHLKDEKSIRNQWGSSFCRDNTFKIPTPEEFCALGDYFTVYAQTLENSVASRRINALGVFLSNKALGIITKDVSELLETLNSKNEGFWITGKGELKYSQRPAFSFNNDVSDHLRQAFKAVIAVQIERAQKKSRAIFSLLKKFDEKYSREVRENGMLTFKDLPFLLKGSDDESGFHLSSNENINLEERLDASINHYLFDEFQDTSDTQWYIFENLIDELLNSLDDRFRSFFCVGDIKQSIYQWRGGNPELFNQVIAKTAPAAEHLGYAPSRSLTKSYRSSQDILDTSNRIFGDMRPDASALFKGAVQKMKYEDHTSEKQELSGFTTLISINPKAESLYIKAKMILDTIKRIDPFSKNLTVGVLQHKNDKMRQLADTLKALAVLERVDIAVSVDGWQTPQDSMAYTFLSQLLILANHPADKKARTFLDMLTFDEFKNETPEPLTVEKMAERFGFEDVKDFDQLSAAVRRDIFLNGLHGFIGNFIDAFKSELSSFDYNRISAVRNLAEKYDGNTDEFIEAIGDWLKTQDQSIKKTIQFMTIHKSKGLEFDIVFIPDTAGPPQASPLPEIARAGEISDGTRWINYLPVKNICCQIPDLEFHTQQLAQENAFAQCCKYYVALTRAKRAMYIFVELPKTSSTFRFEMEMAKQLERFVPEDHYKISFSAMKTRCYFRDQVDLVYASGSENWYESIDTEKVEPDAAPECTDLKFIYPSKGRRLASHQDSGFIQIPPEVRFAEHSAADLGTELHNLFEKIDFIDDSFDADGFLAGQEYAQTISAEAKELFRIAVAPGSPIRSALAEPSGKYILWKERRFLIKDDDGATVPGAFDRVIIYLDEAENPVRAAILDYKSDKVESLSELISRHRKQLELYRKCLGKMTGIPESEIQISLAALRSGEIAEII